ncbi:uncharacterized protein LACBIDRAFT_321348 [Laccaria bicolor S238N-H82]|uniref:Predicted protein n=1 Tax=Laccaria bicolor (strain S238N-H82 / ATCC MYA-4686) TaxID=486041 RepID=B0CPW2_LACBS|nr:uncharacterized protein LACBIDRAFT_321348 [Laccaria bicolor S238N-H82]EDR15484.1 predicted protein [Laccaria bicolor S238N-H82]|eukprot:XP_001873692.1 predicted protein [Laccaria bicolor S238N-H82]
MAGLNSTVPIVSERSQMGRLCILSRKPKAELRTLGSGFGLACERLMVQMPIDSLASQRVFLAGSSPYDSGWLTFNGVTCDLEDSESVHPFGSLELHQRERKQKRCLLGKAQRAPQAHMMTNVVWAIEFLPVDIDVAQLPATTPPFHER